VNLATSPVFRSHLAISFEYIKVVQTSCFESTMGVFPCGSRLL
jgi:hypothetical protein